MCLTRFRLNDLKWDNRFVWVVSPLLKQTEAIAWNNTNNIYTKVFVPAVCFYSLLQTFAIRGQVKRWMVYELHALQLIDTHEFGAARGQSY